MRARRLRPRFDTLAQRIAPSGVTPVAAPVNAPSTCGSTPTIVTDLDPWLVTGPPQSSPTNVLNPKLDPTCWLVAN